MVKIEINYAQLKRAINQLSIVERTKLVRELEKDTLKPRLCKIFKDIDNKRKAKKISIKDISKEIDMARKEFYEGRR